MTLQNLSYPITDFGPSFNFNNFNYELDNSSFVSKLRGVTNDFINNDIIITVENITPSEIIELDNIIANHYGYPVFQNYKAFIEDSSISSTSSSDYQQKLRLTTDYIEEGDYKIEWTYNWCANKRNVNFEAQIEVDDTTVIGEHFEEPITTKSSSKFRNNGFAIINLSRGIHTIDLDYRRENNSNSTVKIFDAKISIEKKDQS